MKIALVSLNQVWEDKKANQLNCQKYIQQASSLNCEFIVFPEMTLTGFSMNTQLIKENPDQSQTIEFFTHQAQKYSISIAFGVVFEKADKATNNMVIIDNSGKRLSAYSKIHPFSFSGENNFYYGGDEIVFCQIGEMSIGSAICYDLRFPEIYQALSQNSNIIITIANWPEKRVKHWTHLLQARAIENQSFIIGVNRTGTDGNSINYVRSSFVYNPVGEIMNPIHTVLEMDIFDLNLEDVDTIRKSFPMKQDRKTELYKSIL